MEKKLLEGKSLSSPSLLSSSLLLSLSHFLSLFLSPFFPFSTSLLPSLPSHSLSLLSLTSSPSLSPPLSLFPFFPLFPSFSTSLSVCKWQVGRQDSCLPVFDKAPLHWTAFNQIKNITAWLKTMSSLWCGADASLSVVNIQLGRMLKEFNAPQRLQLQNPLTQR